jgi:hypothetical protein
MIEIVGYSDKGHPTHFPFLSLTGSTSFIVPANPLELEGWDLLQRPLLELPHRFTRDVLFDQRRAYSRRQEPLDGSLSAPYM